MEQTTEKAPSGATARRIRNFVLRPVLQAKIGVYTILLSLVFGSASAVYTYFAYSKAIHVVLELTDLQAEVASLFRSFFWETGIVLGIFLTFYMFFMVILSVLLTHRLVGPVVAFRRHVDALRKGNFQFRTHLRKGDAFEDLAEDLNALSEHFESTMKHG